MARSQRMTAYTRTCPGCGNEMRSNPFENATSRFATGVYICSQCGVKEAFEGPFWRPTLRLIKRLAQIQEPWIDAWR